MPGIVRTGVNSAGGIVNSARQSFVRVGGRLWGVLGDPVAGHGPSPHDGPSMAAGSSFVRINGIPACRAGHAASCGHAANGSLWARISD